MENLSDVAKIFKAFDDEKRLQILKMLSDEEKCACVLLESLNISQPTLSHHMKILTDCNLVSMRKEGKWAYYSINFERFSQFKSIISEITCKNTKGCKCRRNEQ